MANLNPLRREELPQYEEMFATIEQQAGFVPNAFPTMARRPGMLDALQVLIQQVFAGSVPRETKSLVALMSSYGAGCRYCQAHQATSLMHQGIDAAKMADVADFERSERFTDADTFHKPGSLVRAVAEVEQHGAALLSYSPEQEVHGFWERAVMPVIFAELAATYPPKKVNDPASRIAAANGQYLMISREAYDAVGGHAAISSNLLEDVAMARMVKSSGRKIFFRYGGDAVRTRMYRSWAQMKEGWTKNLALLFPKPAELAWKRLWQFIIFVSLPPSLLRGAYWEPFLDHSRPGLLRWQSLFLGIVVGVYFVFWLVAYVARMRKSHSGWLAIGLGIFGLPVFAYLLWRSDRACKNARFDWKDRTYVYTPEEGKALSAAHPASGGNES